MDEGADVAGFHQHLAIDLALNRKIEGVDIVGTHGGIDGRGDRNAGTVEAWVAGLPQFHGQRSVGQDRRHAVEIRRRAKGVGGSLVEVVSKQAANFRAQNVFTLWQVLDNNTNGAGGAGFNFARSLMGTPTSNATYGGAGQVTGLSIGTANGYSNYHGAYFSFKASDFHGLTLQENLTISKRWV
jgi:hypothetical protein